MQLQILAGSSGIPLGNKIAAALGVNLFETEKFTFASKEILVRPKETVRGHDVFVIQGITEEINTEYMELFILIDSLKRASAGRICLVLPYFGYARQDRKAKKREPISAKLIADLLTAVGAHYMMTIRLHSSQIQGFFNVPVDNISADDLFVQHFRKKIMQKKDWVVVSPDIGGTTNAKKLADKLEIDLVIMNKTRPHHNKAVITRIIGSVNKKHCIIFDDMIDTGGTVIACASELKKKSADQVYLAATHPIFSGEAIKHIAAAGFKEVVVTDTVTVEKRFHGLVILSVAPLLAQVIKNVHEGVSVEGLIEG